MTQKNNRRERWLVAAVVGQGLVIAGLVMGGHSSGPELMQAAVAQVPDAGAQRLVIIDELRQIGRRVDTLQATLEGGIKVTVEGGKIER
jgi:hypothetical protein